MADPDEPRGELEQRGPEQDEPAQGAPREDGRRWLERLGEVPSPRRPWLPSALTLAAGALCALVGGARLGRPGVVSGMAAALVVLAFFVSSSLPLSLSQGLGDRRGPGLVLLLTNYAFRVVAALAVVALLVRSGWGDRGVAGLSVILCALVRVNTQALLLLGRRGGAGASR